jgi:hypothetical protein
MNYTEARKKIKTGDIINIRKHSGIISKLTEIFTRSPYTHTGISIWLNGGLWMAEINSGHNHLIPLSQFADINFDVFECPVDRNKVRTDILESLRVRVNYGIISFILLGIYNLFRIKERVSSLKDKVCSEYVQDILINAGWNSPGKMVSPYDLSKILKLKFEVRK